jgi:hypothetical protein
MGLTVLKGLASILFTLVLLLILSVIYLYVRMGIQIPHSKAIGLALMLSWLHRGERRTLTTKTVRETEAEAVPRAGRFLDGVEGENSLCEG